MKYMCLMGVSVCVCECVNVCAHVSACLYTVGVNVCGSVCT